MFYFDFYNFANGIFGIDVYFYGNNNGICFFEDLQTFQLDDYCSDDCIDDDHLEI